MSEQNRRSNDSTEVESDSHPGFVYSGNQIGGQAQAHFGHSYVQQTVTLNLGRRATPTTQREFGMCLGQAPMIEPDAFIGRTAELQQLQEWLLPGNAQTQKIVSIVGMGGLGKTQLSLAYVRKHGHRYSSVFWLNAKDEMSLRQSISALSSIIFSGDAKTAVTADETGERAQRVRRWLSEGWNSRWLLIFDNYDDPALPNIRSQTGFDIRPFFPERTQGCILITTRSPKLTFSKRLMLQKLGDLEQSIALLSQRSGRHLAGDKDVQRLALRLDGLPLALATAGTFLSQQTNISCTEYLSLYDTAWTDLHGPETEELLEYADRTLSSTWTISLDQVRSQDTDAAELLGFLGYFSNQDIWFELIQAGADNGPSWISQVTSSKVRFGRAMSKLQDYSLVEANAGNYQVHPCLHDWILEHLNASPNETLFVTALLCLVKSIPDRLDIQYWSISRRLFDHITRIQHQHFIPLQEQSASNMNVLEAWHTFGDLYTSWVEYPKAEEMYLRSMTLKEKARGKGHRSVLKTYNSLGVLYASQGKLDEAESLFIQAQAGYEKARGPDHKLTLYTITNLGNLYADQGKLTEAEEVYQRVLTAYETKLGLNDPSTLDTVNNLGLLYYDQGKLEEAEKMYLRALSGFESVLGTDHTSTLNTANNLGLLYVAQGNLEQAEVMHLRAAAGYELTLGRGHASTLSVVNNLGFLYRDQGRFNAAAEKFSFVLSTYQGNDVRERWKSTVRYLAKVLSASVRTSIDDIYVARSQMAALIRHIERWGGDNPDMIHYLTKALSSVRDDDNAKIAYTKYVKLRKDVPIASADFNCDGCDCGITVVSGHHMCRVCGDADLCNTCIPRYAKNALTVPDCSGHEYFDAGSSVSDSMKATDDHNQVNMSTWLEKLKEKYPIQNRSQQT